MEGNALVADDDKVEVENQFILRLPEKQAAKVRNVLQQKPKKIKKVLSINLDVDKRVGVVTVNKKKLHGELVTLPTIVESNKCIDKVHLFKTADISQMLICKEGNKQPVEEPDKDSLPKVYPHGIAPPFKNVKRYRFRKTKENNNTAMQESDIEKEILWLLRMDNAAVATKFEICYEEPIKELQACGELEIFGDVISDDSEQASSSEENNEIIEYTN